MSLMLASDIEAVGFYDSVKSVDDIHCLCSIDVLTDEVYLFHEHPEFDNQEVFDKYDGKTYKIPARKGGLEDGVRFWRENVANGGKLIIHNAMGYDKHIVDKIWPDNGISIDGYIDTYVQSKLQWADRPTPKGCKSGHSLKAFGIKLRINKPEITDWVTMDVYKLHRVIEDCRIQVGTYEILQAERNRLKEELDIDFTTALKTEHLYAWEGALQEISGAKVDVPYIRTLIEDLDQKIEALSEEITPLLPPTIKRGAGETGSGTRLSRKEIAEVLGFNSSKIQDEYITKFKDGIPTQVPVKPYYAPMTNIFSTQKSRVFKGFHLSHGYSPEFPKKSDFVAWRNTNHPTTKPSEWNVEGETIEKKSLSKNVCEYFGIEPDSDMVLGAYTKVAFVDTKLSQHEAVKAYLVTLGWRNPMEWNEKKDSYGQKVRVEEPTEVRWPVDARPEDQLVYVVPKGGNLVTSPKLSEEDYDQLPEGIGKKIAEYNTYVHRRNFLENRKDPENKGLLSYVREDGRIPCGVNNFGTSTGRSTHRVWVNAPSEKALYGAQIRAVLVAPEGRKLVGVDQKSSQLSIAAFFANNWDYYQAVASGKEYDDTDPDNKIYLGESAHCFSARFFGLVSEEEWMLARETQEESILKKLHLARAGSKNGSFGVIFGCSGKKLSVMLKIDEKEGNAKKNEFLERMGLEGVKRFLLEVCKVEYKFRSGFYIPLPFGYWVYCTAPHAAINYLVQGTEAVAQKLAELRAIAQFKREGIENCFRVLSMHDESLYECDDKDAARVGQIANEAFTWASDQIFDWYNRNLSKFPNDGKPMFKIDLAGGYQIGNNYGECH